MYMLSLDILYEKLPFLGFIIFMLIILQGMFRLKRFLGIPFLLFLFILVGIPFIKDLVWLFGALEISAWGYHISKRWPRSYSWPYHSNLHRNSPFLSLPPHGFCGSYTKAAPYRPWHPYGMSGPSGLLSHNPLETERKRMEVPYGDSIHFLSYYRFKWFMLFCSTLFS